MNNPLNAPQSPDELVLRLIGGERDGQFFTVQNEKCLLSDLSPSIENPENCRCVIFRGEKGVAFRSYSDHVLCNGAKVSVQWLKKGDLIKLTDNFSVEVYQLGVYTKKTPTASTTARQPVNTVELPGNANPATSGRPPVVVRQEAMTVPNTAAVSDAASTTTSPDYAKPSVQFPSVSSSPLGEAPKFKPATSNLRTPAVTAPLQTHKVPTEASTPAPSVSRMPVVTQAIDVASESVASSGTPSAPTTPSTPSNATIDSLTERLSKLVDSAAGTAEAGLEDEATNIPAATRPSVSTMPIESTPVEIADESSGDGLTPDATPQQPLAVAQPAPPTDSTANPERTPAQTVLNTPDAADSAAQRRAALENYFSKSGVSLSDTITPPEVESATPASPVSPEVTQVETATSGQPASTAKPTVAPELPSLPSTQVMATEAIAATPDLDQPKETVANEPKAASPEFDLDSVLAKLESGTTNSPSQTPAAETSAVQQPPVVAPPVSESPVVAPPVGETAVTEATVGAVSAAADAIEQPPVAATDDTAPSSEPTDGNQGSQLESFALLQSLGLDTSGLGQIKKELAEAPLREEIESISLNAEQQTQPETVEAEAPEPEKVESVADVLARMQNAGSLQDFNAGEAEAESASEEITQTAAPTPPPASPSVATTATSTVSAQANGGAEDDGSVEDYMSQLLNRMRGETEPTSGEVAEQKQDKAAEKIAAVQESASFVSETVVEKVQTLTPEEFVPKQKAVRMQSLDSLREIANSNAREAFRDSLARERKVTTKTKLTLSLLSWGFALLFFLMSFMAEKTNYWGVVFGLGFMLIGVYTLRVYLSEKKLDDSIMSD